MTVPSQTNLSNSSVATPAQADFQSVRLLEVELSNPIPDVPVANSISGQPYRRGQVLVRLHSQPVGIVQVTLSEKTLSAAEYAQQLWDALGTTINDHLHEDGLAPVQKLGSEGLSTTGTPSCIQQRTRLKSNEPFVSVIIATHNRAHSLPITLNSLLELDYSNFEIVVVDNAPSNEDTAELIQREYGNKRVPVRYVRDDRPGLGRAHNAGIKVINAPFAAFTDDDVVADRYWLSEMVKDFLISEDIGCVTGMIVPAELETQPQVWIEQYGGFSKGFTRRMFDLKQKDHGPLYPFTAGLFGSGASMAFRTSVLREMNGFDAALGAGTTALGGDDLASFFEVIIRGYKLVYEPASIVHHQHRREYVGLQRLAFGYGVGLTAYLTKALMDRPALLFSFLMKIPYGLFHIFSSKSSKNAKKLSDYPAELNQLERKGMINGPLLYWRSRRLAARAKD